MNIEILFVRRRIQILFVLVGLVFFPSLFSFKNQINLMIFRGQVTIFNPHDYPDMTSGGVIDFLVSPRKHRSVELEAIVFYSIRNIIPYPLEKRDCVFQDEMTSFHMFYTYSDCIVDSSSSVNLCVMYSPLSRIFFFLERGLIKSFQNDFHRYVSRDFTTCPSFYHHLSSKLLAR